MGVRYVSGGPGQGLQSSALCSVCRNTSGLGAWPPRLPEAPQRPPDVLLLFFILSAQGRLSAGSRRKAGLAIRDEAYLLCNPAHKIRFSWPETYIFNDRAESYRAQAWAASTVSLLLLEDAADHLPGSVQPARE